MKDLLLVIVSFLVGMGVMYYAGPHYLFSKQTGSAAGTKTITYKIPDMSSLKKLQVGTSTAAGASSTLAARIAQLSKPTNLRLPSSVVNPTYTASLNAILDQGNQIELELSEKLYPKMQSIQKEALAGNYTAMFQNILNAKKEVTTTQAMAVEFQKRINNFSSAYNYPGMRVGVKSSSQEFQTAAQRYHDQLVVTMKLFDQSLVGSVPSQSLVEQMSSAVDNLNKQIAAYSTSLQGLVDQIKRSAS